MAENKKTFWQQLKDRLAVDSIDTNDEKLYKNLARGPGPNGCSPGKSEIHPRYFRGG